MYMYRPEDRKRLILVLGLLSLVLLVMPSASAKFTGQHEFLAGSEVQCTKCHPSVGTELQSHTTHNFSVSGYTDGACRVCHIIRISGSSLENLYQQNSTEEYHAAALIECTYCHGDNAGGSTGYGTSPIPGANVTQEFENSNIEAHIPLYNRAKQGGSTDFLRGANEACIACHTAAAEVNVIEPAVALQVNATLRNASNCNIDCYESASGIGNSTFKWEIKIEVNQTIS
jgi:hypothetical protein